ncbi:MAG: YciI family protein [Actinomycetota bacterium]
MQYALLIYQGSTPLPNTPAWSTLSQDEQKAVYADYAAINEMENVTPGLPLGLPEKARTVRVEDGTPRVEHGPYMDVKGAIGGFSVVEADDLDAAIALAARVPAAGLGGAVEIRAVETYW